MIPYGAIVSGGGQALKMLNAWNSADARDQAIGQSIKNRDFWQGKMDSRLMSEIGALRGSTPEAERVKAMGEFMQAFRAAQPGMAGDGGVAPGLGGARAQATAADTRAGLQSFGRREADITARTVAPMRQRLNEGLGMSRARSDMQLLAREMSKQNFLDELRIARKSQGNPWMDALGDVMMGAGSAMGAGTSSLGNAGRLSGYSAAAQRAGTGNYVYGGPRG